MSNYASTDAGFKIAPYLRILNEVFQLDVDDIVANFRGVYGCKVERKDGVVGYWIVNIREGKGKVEFNSQTKPDVTFVLSDDTSVEIVRNNLGLQKAFFSGALKIQGNLRLALNLLQLQPIVESEIDKIRSKL